MTGESFVKAQLAAYAYTEGSAAGGAMHMRAICQVIRNRVYAGWCGGDWMENLNRADEWSAFEPSKKKKFDLRDELFRRILQEVDDVYTGAYTDPLCADALYFYDLLRQDGKNGDRHIWFTNNILRRADAHPRIAQVGMLYLFS